MLTILSHQVVNRLTKEGLQTLVLFDPQDVQGAAEFRAEVSSDSPFTRPAKVFEFYECVTWLSIGALMLNLTIVTIMFYSVFHSNREKAGKAV